VISTHSLKSGTRTTRDRKTFYLFLVKQGKALEGNIFVRGEECACVCVRACVRARKRRRVWERRDEYSLWAEHYSLY